MQGREPTLWRRRLSRELAGLIALKLVALALLWWLFFSPTHRTRVDADSTSQRLGVTETSRPDPFRSATSATGGAGGD